MDVQQAAHQDINTTDEILGPDGFRYRRLPSQTLPSPALGTSPKTRRQPSVLDESGAVKTGVAESIVPPPMESAIPPAWRRTDRLGYGHGDRYCRRMYGRRAS
jgi:hypothetical protein